MKDNNYSTKYVISDVKSRQSFTSVKELKKFQNHVDNTEVANPLKFVLGFILLGILIISLFRIAGYIGDNSPLTFAGFLDYLSNLNIENVNLDIGNVVIDGNWGILDFFRIFLNSIFGIFRFALSICSTLINVLIFLFNIGKFILYGA